MSQSMILMLPHYVDIDNLLTFTLLRGFSVSVLIHNLDFLVAIPFLFVEYNEQEKIELWRALV